MIVIYSFNKSGYEAKYWNEEIKSASTNDCVFIPFNHGKYLTEKYYLRAQLLDNIYYEQNSYLMNMYDDLEKTIKDHNADALIVDNCFPYHPEFLKNLHIYKFLRTTDGPISAYDRDFAYLHAYDHILYHSPAYSKDMTMEEKLKYCGAKKMTFWPLLVFNSKMNFNLNEQDIYNNKREIDIIFIGRIPKNKMPLICDIKKHYRSRFKLFGLVTWKGNIRLNLYSHYPMLVRSLKAERYKDIYSRSKIGINVHNRGKYTVGNYRLFELPANGVMQISDGDEYLQNYYEIGKEIETYNSSNDLINKIDYYLSNDQERLKIALNGYKRTISDYTCKKQMNRLIDIIKECI